VLAGLGGALFSAFGAALLAVSFLVAPDFGVLALLLVLFADDAFAAVTFGLAGFMAADFALVRLEPACLTLLLVESADV
jgi:hypothetical protein